jgi:hypothetical protein
MGFTGSRIGGGEDGEDWDFFMARSPWRFAQAWKIPQNDTLLSTIYSTISSGKKCIYSSNEHQKSRTCPILVEALMQTLLEAAGPMGSTGMLP